MPIVVTATFRPSVGAKADLIAALTSTIAGVHGEVGCELFALHDAADGAVVLIEKWTSVEALDAHGAGEPVRRLNATIAPHIAEPPVVIRMIGMPAGTEEQGML